MESEKFLGRALRGGWREKIHLATKMPQWMVDEPAKFDLLFNEQLERLNTDHIDFYLIHALDLKSWKKMEGFDVLSWAEKRMADGSIRHLGFSFHDDYEAFKTIVDAYDWDFCQIQYNYMDIENQAGIKGLRYAAERTSQSWLWNRCWAENWPSNHLPKCRRYGIRPKISAAPPIGRCSGCGTSPKWRRC
jgi:uncharacterized protein